MEYKEVKDKIKQINTENVIWIIYIIIIFMSWYANYFEKKYYLNNDNESKEKYKSSKILAESHEIIKKERAESLPIKKSFKFVCRNDNNPPSGPFSASGQVPDEGFYLNSICKLI